MGLEGMSLGSWVVILIIVALVFGTKKLKNSGKDLGAAIKGFRQGLQEETRKEAEDA